MVTLRDRLDEVQSLPSLPTTVIRLIRGLSGEGLGADELEAIVRTDEAISAAVLRLANSSQQGQSERVLTLQESIARLGTRVLQKIAVAQQCHSVLGQGGEGFGLIRGQLWAGSLAGALGAELVAKDSQVADPSVCFVAGLLRDIGKLAMDQLLGAGEVQRAFTGASPEQKQVGIERAAFGVAHPEVGEALAEMWGIPDDIGRAIRYHHEPDEAPEGDRSMSDVVHCGDALAMWMGLGIGYDGLSYPVSRRAKEVVGLKRRVVEDYMVRVKESLDAIMEELG